MSSADDEDNRGRWRPEQSRQAGDSTSRERELSAEIERLRAALQSRGTQGGSIEEWNELRAALKPLADIADEYDADGLDEARPYWVLNGHGRFDPDAELYSGRGGKQLLTLRHAMEARRVLTGKPHSSPAAERWMLRAKEIYEATNDGGSGWSVLGEDRRTILIEKYRKAGLL